MNKNLYEILGLDKSATQDDIKKAYRKLCKQYHPDVSSEPDSDEKIREINEAYSILSDENKKKEYDSPSFSNENIFDFNDLLNHIRTSNLHAPRRGEDYFEYITVPLTDLLDGCTMEHPFRINDPCKNCNGRRFKSFEKCKGCEGTGRKVEKAYNITVKRPCQDCGGQGNVGKEPCSDCINGFVVTNRVANISIPPSINGTCRVRVREGGMSGVNGGPPGDAWFNIIPKFPDMSKMSQVDKENFIRICKEY
jgi:molecular chaperone DnaJ